MTAAADASAQKPRTAIIQQAPRNEQRCPGGGALVRRADAPEDKNRNGWVCEDPGQGGAVRDDRSPDEMFIPRGEFFTGQRRGNVGPLPGDTTSEESFPSRRIRALMKDWDSTASRDYVSCSGEHSRSTHAPTLAIAPEWMTQPAGGGRRLLSGPNTRLCLTRDAVPRSDGQLFVLNQSVASGYDPSGAAGGWRTWVTVFDRGADGDAKPVRSFDVAEARIGAATGFAVDREGWVYIASAPWQERTDGSIEVFAARAKGNMRPIRTIYGQRRTGQPVGLAVDPWDSLYVTNQPYAAVRVYSPRAQADSPAVRLLGGMNTGFVIPIGLALDRQQRLFVADRAGDLRIFDRGETGDVEPWRVISGGVGDPYHVAIDGGGLRYVRGERGAGVYAADAFGESKPLKLAPGESAPTLFASDWADQLYVLQRDTVMVFAPGGWIDRAPSRVLAVAPGVTGMAVDRSGWLYLANGDSSFVAAYPPRARGNDSPARVIAGDRTRLTRPTGLAIDRHDNLYVVNGKQPASEAAIRVYGPGARGEALATRVISGGSTGLKGVADLALDSRGDLYVAERGRIAVFAKGVDGNLAPSRVLNGPQAGLGPVRRIAIGLGDTLYVLSGTDMPHRWSGPMSRRPILESTLAVYPPMASGDDEPVRTVAITREGKSEGLATGGFLSPSGMEVDSTGAVHVSFCDPTPSVVTYAPGASGAVAPTRMERADTGSFTGPSGLTTACWGGFMVVAK